MTQLSNPYLPALIPLLQQANGYQQARRANEKRRDEILKGRSDTRNRVLDQWKGYGDSLVADTNEEFDKALNNSRAHLSQLGMLGSTNVEALNWQTAKQKLNELRRVKDDITRNYADTDERLSKSNNIDEFKERIVDEYPDNSQSLSQIAGLLSNLGPYGGYGGGAMPGRPLPYQLPQMSAMQSASIARAPLPPRPPARTMAEQVAQANARNANPAYDEQQRRTGMINLTNSMVQGWPNIDRERQALNYLVNNGWAKQDPAATTNAVVDTSSRYGPDPGYYGGGGYGANPRQSTARRYTHPYGMGPAYRQRMDAIAKSREAGKRVDGRSAIENQMGTAFAVNPEIFNDQSEPVQPTSPYGNVAQFLPYIRNLLLGI